MNDPSLRGSTGPGIDDSEEMESTSTKDLGELDDCVSDAADPVMSTKDTPCKSARSPTDKFTVHSATSSGLGETRLGGPVAHGPVSHLIWPW